MCREATVARWYICIPINPNLEIFCEALEWKMLVYLFPKYWWVLYLYGIYHSQYVVFLVIWYILWPIGMCCGPLAYLSTFWYVVPRKIWQPWPNPILCLHNVQTVRVPLIRLFAKWMRTYCASLGTKKSSHSPPSDESVPGPMLKFLKYFRRKNYNFVTNYSIFVQKKTP
jgi:hypothetical protein